MKKLIRRILIVLSVPGYVVLSLLLSFILFGNLTGTGLMLISAWLLPLAVYGAFLVVKYIVDGVPKKKSFIDTRISCEDKIWKKDYQEAIHNINKEVL
ncbi:MAG: hypothetical protein EHM32_11290 [Spirochaetales bacterium]|nr:MAG: hypothetical protein EHM32_11290 [Spirochaetales bacterium]